MIPRSTASEAASPLASVSGRPWARTAALVVAGALGTALGARLEIPLPFTPVPITLQTLFVLLAGGLLGARSGTASQGVYLLAGGLGLPVFAGGAFGFGHLAGPTGGYLLGFLAAPWVVGRLLSSPAPAAGGDVPGSFRTLLALFAGGLVIFLLGLAQLAVYLAWGGGAGQSAPASVWDLVRRTLYLGFWPFLPGFFVKLALAWGIVRTFRAPARRLAGDGR